jgi:hypothetical protein
MPDLVKIELFCWVEDSASFALQVRCSVSCGVGECKPSQRCRDGACNKSVATSINIAPCQLGGAPDEARHEQRVIQLKHLCSNRDSIFNVRVQLENGAS